MREHDALRPACRTGGIDESSKVDIDALFRRSVNGQISFKEHIFETNEFLSSARARGIRASHEDAFEMRGLRPARLEFVEFLGISD
jgi:hypothetical protein